MIGFNAKYHAIGTSINVSATWNSPSTTAAREYARKNPNDMCGSASWVKKEIGKGPNIATSAAISKKKSPAMCMAPSRLIVFENNTICERKKQ